MIHFHYYFLNKYPENESLLSLKHLVPPLTITYVKEQKVKAQKKKQKQDTINNNGIISYPIIIYEDTTQNNNNVSYPIIKYEDKTSSNIENKSYPIIKYEDKTSSNSENKSYPIVKYEDKTSSIKKQQPAYEIVKYYQ